MLTPYSRNTQRHICSFLLEFSPTQCINTVYQNLSMQLCWIRSRLPSLFVKMWLKRFHGLWWNLTKWCWQCILFSKNKVGKVILFHSLLQWFITSHSLFTLISMPSYCPMPEYIIQGKENNITFLIEKQWSFTFLSLKHMHTRTHTNTKENI